MLFAAVALPALTALACALVPARIGDRAGSWGAAGAATALALTGVVAFAVASQGPVAAALPGGTPAVLHADRLTIVMLALVLGVSTLTQLFTGRYLSGDPRQCRLVAAMGATTSAAAVLVSAATLGLLLAAWIAAGLGLLAMFAQRADLPSARLGLRRAAAAFAVGDLALVAACALVWTGIGGLDVRDVGAAAHALADTRIGVAGLSVPTAPVVACLLVVAAMGRCALLPLHRWLPATLAAPTPVSAFMHAGLVNAGGFLLVRLGPVFSSSGLATHLAFAVGALTAFYGTALMLSRPDTKGALAYSTIGQMGFMVMACALGAFAFVVFHLVAHGMYKAALFLGAGSAIGASKRHRAVPRPAPAGVGWPAPTRLAVAAAVPAAVLWVCLTTFASGVLEQPGALALLPFAWASAAHALWAWLGATPGRAGAGVAATAVVCASYAVLLVAAKGFLAPALEAAARPVSPWLVLVPATVLAVALLARLRPVSSVESDLYARALDAGWVTASDTWRATAHRGSAPTRTPAPISSGV
nr:proton-conducting transporter membrane subunit [Nocardiopsis mwathae]